ncbi:MAG: carboxypeptidase-like regulatory domain-containing protein, partial [Bacteroidota bacterium]
MHSYSLSCLLFCLSGILPAQLTLTGIVVDEANGAPLPFVYVFLESDQDYGVITNERGEYQIRLTEEQRQGHLVFSLMSYQTHRFPLRDLAPEQTVYNLQMATSFLELEEIVVVSDKGLRRIVRETLDNIPNVYGHKDYLLKAYYRRYDIENGEYAQLIDAMVTVRDRPYLSPKYVTHDLTERSLPQGYPVKAWADEFRLSDYNGTG